MVKTKLLWMVPVGLLSILACAPVEKETGEDIGGTGFQSDRKRRLIYYDSASQQSHGYLDRGVETPFMSLLYDVTDEQSFLDVRTSLTFDTQVDTYVWHIGNGCDPPYDIPKKMLWPCFSSYEQVRDVVIKACHQQGIEIWASLRMNDLHSSFRSRTLEETDDPLKAQHPEYLISPPSVRDLPTELTEQRLWVAFNYAHSGVRQHRLDFIEKTASEHDFDGYELDFNRMGISFPLGEEQQHAHLLTDLIRQIRERLNAIGERRGRPYTLAIHVMDSLETSLELGMEVERWSREGLVDVLLVGLGYMPSQVPIDQWVELAKRYRVQVYPTINPNTFRAGAWEEWSDKPVFQQAMRAAADRPGSGRAKTAPEHGSGRWRPTRPVQDQCLDCRGFGRHGPVDQAEPRSLAQADPGGSLVSHGGSSWSHAEGVQRTESLVQCPVRGSLRGIGRPARGRSQRIPEAGLRPRTKAITEHPKSGHRPPDPGSGHLSRNAVTLLCSFGLQAAVPGSIEVNPNWIASSSPGFPNPG